VRSRFRAGRRGRGDLLGFDGLTVRAVDAVPEAEVAAGRVVVDQDRLPEGDARAQLGCPGLQPVRGVALPDGLGRSAATRSVCRAAACASTSAAGCARSSMPTLTAYPADRSSPAVASIRWRRA